MKDLIGIFEAMGCERVQTYIQSGNVVFERGNGGRVDAEGIERRILAEYGFEPKVMLLRATDLRAAVAENPFVTDDGRALHFFFFSDLPGRPNLDLLASLRAPSEAFILGETAFFLHAPDGVGRSKLAARVESALGVPVTARNWNTVRKLVEMVGQG